MSTKKPSILLPTTDGYTPSIELLWEPHIGWRTLVCQENQV